MNDDITLYRQIYPRQCAPLKALGYQSIMNVRPDNETPEQPSSAQIADAAKEAGLHYYHLPVVQQSISKAAVQQFADYYKAAPKPIFMCCATGARAKKLYQIACVQGLL